jgi:DNA replication protein DnaC
MSAKERLEYLECQLRYMGLDNMALRLDGMYNSPGFNSMDRLQVLEELIASEYEVQTTRRLSLSLKKARLSGSPAVYSNCVDTTRREYLPDGVTRTLGSLSFIKDGENICILGPSNAGKSYFSKAIAIEACLKNYRAYYCHCYELVEELASIKECDYKKYKTKIRFYSKLDLLILDDFLLHSIESTEERKTLFELMERRNELHRSTIVCSQREGPQMLEHNDEE